MTRGEIWPAQAGRTTRPVLIVTRPEVIDVRHLVTVAEVATSARGLAAEVAFDHETAGVDHSSVINCDGLHTIARSSLNAPNRRRGRGAHGRSVPGNRLRRRVLTADGPQGFGVENQRIRAVFDARP